MSSVTRYGNVALGVESALPAARSVQGAGRARRLLLRILAAFKRLA